MRILRWLCALLLLQAAWAADITIKVVDPQSAVVPGASVLLQRSGTATPVAVQSTSGNGTVRFSGLAGGSYEVRVLAPGFAPLIARANSPGEVTLQLRIATATQNVVVSATRTPVPGEETGAEVSSLSAGELKTMQPVNEADALRFLPDAIIGENGRRGALASLFVRGGDSRYNKVIVDGVTVNDPGGRFDFGVVPMDQVDRLEFVRGAESDLYGSDAMTSVVQTWSREGTTAIPQLSFGADGGTFQTANGYAALSGARGRFDYNLFGEQFNTNGQGPNDQYSNSSQGANLGLMLSPRVRFRLRARHLNSRTGIQSFWDFNGQPLLPPDMDEKARQNDFLSSAEITVNGTRWQHTFTGFEYHHQLANVDQIMEPGRVSPSFGNIDFPFDSISDINRAGFEYQGQYWERNWARVIVGYRFEDENGFVGDLFSPPLSHGLRLNHDVYAQQLLTRGRASLVAGLRFTHNGSFGNAVVPRIAPSLLLLRGGSIFSGTRLLGSFATGIKEPLLEEAFAAGAFVIPNPSLKAEENRAFDAGIEQRLVGGRFVLAATYFHNIFRRQIEFASNPVSFVGQYVNVNKSLAHGAEGEFHARLWSRLSLDSSYTYTSTQILAAPLCTAQNFCDPLLAAGRQLVRRPRHAGNVLLNYASRRWGGQVGGLFMGPRVDSDFLGLLPPVTHTAGYGRVDLGGWYALTRHMSAYLNIGNLFDRRYEEAAGYPALGFNFRAGMRFRVGGE
ncbi:MAG TPA: TonB-dependent receptor [Terriglobales bacterium]|nr:TonB-dependent receptor [Terriglobales bacterium]